MFATVLNDPVPLVAFAAIFVAAMLVRVRSLVARRGEDPRSRE